MLYIKPQPIEIDENSPFENDKLGREENAKILTQFVKDLNEPYVIAIDAPWGFGKTTFLTMWMAYLKQKGAHSLYFNAWENDFDGDPLVALLQQIEFSISGNVNKKTRDAFGNVKKIGGSLMKNALPALIKAATFGALDTKEMTEEFIASVAENFAEEQFLAYEKAKVAFDTFKKNLSEFVVELDSDYPLVFMIDELDRCRPDYALSVMEKIKHLFSIKGIVFVLALDKQQMGCSIKTLYGAKMRVNEYLKRFIDLEYNLPEPKIRDFVISTIERHGLDDFFDLRSNIHDKKDTIDAFCKLSELYNLSLRDFEQMISHLTIFIKLTKDNQYLLPQYACFMLFLFRIKKGLYDRLVKNDITPEEVINELGWKGRTDNSFISKMKAFVEYSLCFKKGIRDDNKIEEIMNFYAEIDCNSDGDKDIRQEASIIIRTFEFFTNELRGDDVFRYIRNKIEILQPFEIGN